MFCLVISDQVFLGERNICMVTSLYIYINLLLLQKLVPGTLLLGAVREIHNFDVTVSLPYNMVGVVSLSDVSDPLLEMVKREVEAGSQQEDETEEVIVVFLLCECLMLFGVLSQEIRKELLLSQSYFMLASCCLSLFLRN